MIVSKKLIRDSMEGLLGVYISNYDVYKYFKGARHVRGGKITKTHSKKLAGAKVHAFGYDILGNITILTNTGYIIQWLQSDEDDPLVKGDFIKG